MGFMLKCISLLFISYFFNASLKVYGSEMSISVSFS